MNAGSGLAEDRHDQRISRVGPGQLHIVRQLVGWDALEQQLAGVGEFAFVTFKRKLQKPDADGCDKQNYKRQ
jgi:hypothetical protein